MFIRDFIYAFKFKRKVSQIVSKLIKNLLMYYATRGVSCDDTLKKISEILGAIDISLKKDIVIRNIDELLQKGLELTQTRWMSELTKYSSRNEAVDSYYHKCIDCLTEITNLTPETQDEKKIELAAGVLHLSKIIKEV